MRTSVDVFGTSARCAAGDALGQDSGIEARTGSRCNSQQRRSGRQGVRMSASTFTALIVIPAWRSSQPKLGALCMVCVERARKLGIELLVLERAHAGSGRETRPPPARIAPLGAAHSGTPSD